MIFMQEKAKLKATNQEHTFRLLRTNGEGIIYHHQVYVCASVCCHHDDHRYNLFLWVIRLLLTATPLSVQYKTREIQKNRYRNILPAKHIITSL